MQVFFWLNCFPSANGVSTNISPRTIVTGQTVDYNKHCRLEFGSYVQTHEQHDNLMAPRTTGAVTLRPTGNAQGGYYFMSLTTGRRISRNRWTALPMPQDVINRITQMGQQQHADEGIEFQDRDRRDVGDQGNEEDNMNNNDDHSVIQIDQDDDDNNNYDYNYNNGYDYAYQEVNGGANGEQEAVRVPIEEIQDYVPPEGWAGPIEQENMEPGEVMAEDQGEEVIAEPNNIDEQDNVGVERDMDLRYGERTGAYNLRPRRARDYGHLHTTVGHSVLTQLSMKQGLKAFGDQGREAVLSEIKQLHDRGVIQPKSPSTMSIQDKRDALEYLMFLKKRGAEKLKEGDALTAVSSGCTQLKRRRVHLLCR
jgi:hypothetical protein